MAHFKRMVAMLLTLVTLFSMLPVRGSATQTEPGTDVDTGDVNIEATNGFGNLLSDAILQENVLEEESEAGYTVTNLKIEGNTATVTYQTLEEAVVIVALYSEDGMQMYTSARTTVSADTTQATVTFGDTMPDYFMACAYLVDIYDFSPLCAAYETPMYTQEMQELLASTVEDYDQDRVLNLDDDKENNFAIYAQSTIVIEEQEGVNTVVSADNDTMTYIIANADSAITSLAAGDVFAYPYGDNEILVVKVGSITMDGTTATIKGADLEMAEAFAYAKLDTTGTSDDAIVDESKSPEGVTYLGMVPAESDPGSTSNVTHNAPSIEDNVEVSTALAFHVQKTFGKEENGESATISGGLTLSLSMNLEYYLSTNQQFLRFELGYTFKVGVVVEGKASREIPLTPASIPTPILGLYVEITPTFVVEFAVKFEINYVMSASIGFSVDKDNGVQDLCTSPETHLDLSLEGSVFLGIDLKPTVDVGGADLFEFGFSAPIGVEFVGTNTGSAYDLNSEPSGDSVHSCINCLKIERNFKIEFSLTVSFLKFECLTFKHTILEKTTPMGSLYYSIDKGVMGPGTCPYQDYRVTVQVKNENDETVEGAEVFLDGEVLGTTNGKGVVSAYLSDGMYTFSAVVEEELGKQEYQSTVQVFGSAVKVILEPQKKGIISEIIDFIRNLGVVLYFGECGDQGNNVIWRLYSTGVLRLSGSGKMAYWPIEYEVPWYSYTDKIKRVVIDEGITNIGDCAFGYCYNMKEISIPYTVSEIGNDSFFNCSVERINVTDLASWCEVEMYEGLKEPWNLYLNGTKVAYLNVPRSVERIGSYAFYNCAGLEKLTLKESQRTIGDYAFGSCTALNSVIIPRGLTEIGNGAFEGCTALETVSIPDTLTGIGDNAFYGCEKMSSSLKIPDGVTRLGNGVFRDCYALNDVTLPDTLTEIGEYAFYGSGLTSIRVPISLKSVGKYGFSTNSLKNVEIPDLFAWCRIKFANMSASPTINADKVTSQNCDIVGISVPEDVTAIQPGMFANFTELATVNIMGDATEIGERAFYNCTALTKLNIPSTVTKIGNSAFSDSGLERIELSGELTTLGVGAFTRCKALEEVIITAPLSTIDNSTFSGCSALVSVTLPDSITAINVWAFSSCSALEKINLPEGITTIAREVFINCKKLDHVTIPETVTTIEKNAFAGCSTLKDLTMPQTMEEIGAYAFDGCTSLTGIDLPAGLKLIDEFAFRGSGLTSIEFPSDVAYALYVGKGSFANCSSLSEIRFFCDPPLLTGTSSTAVFANVTATAYYPEDWGEGYGKRYGGSITWVPYTLDENGEMIINGAAAVTVTAEPCETEEPVTSEETPVAQTDLEVPSPDFGETEQTLNPDAVFGGEYGTETTDTQTVSTASFAGLVPGEQYILLAMKSIEVEDYLAPENLLFIRQKEAGEDGTLAFSYVQQETTEITYVVVCGASNKSLADAQITFPEMFADGEMQAVDPLVIYDGKILDEGRDYTVMGTVSFTEAGTYTCYLRGIYNYTGLVKCTYTVKNQIAGGTCGNGLTWSLDDAGVLTISGQGSMEDFAGGDTPWWGCMGSILSVKLNTGVTSIGAYAFANCTNLTDVTVPEGVAAVGAGAFSGCGSLREISFAGNAPEFGADVFSGVTADAYYPVGDGTWTEEVLCDYGGDLTWRRVCGSHVYETVVTDPTCTEQGCTTYTCSTCGDTYVGDYVAALGHDFVDGVCTRCGTLSVPAKPYKIANVVSGVHVYWKATEGAAKYGLWRSETGKDGTYKWLANPTVPHFTDTKVESGKTYYYKVTAMNAAGVHSDKSEAIGITYVSTPDITSRSNIAAGVKLGWEKVTGATGYAIYRKSYSGTDAWVRVGTISGNSTFTWTDTSVKNANGTIYKYTIRALAGSNMKTLSGCRNAGRTMARLSSQVMTSAAKASSTSIKCQWTTSSRVTGYEVRFMVGNTVYKTFTVGNYKTGVKTFTGLKAGQTYTIQVRTYLKVDGMGFYSDWSTAKTVKL